MTKTADDYPYIKKYMEETADKLDQILGVNDSKDTGLTGNEAYEALKTEYSTQIRERKRALLDAEKDIRKAEEALQEFDNKMKATEDLNELANMRFERRHYVAALQSARQARAEAEFSGSQELEKDVNEIFK